MQVLVENASEIVTYSDEDNRLIIKVPAKRLTLTLSMEAAQTLVEHATKLVTNLNMANTEDVDLNIEFVKALLNSTD